ncbi:hypothetical protein M2157_007140 [Streptomyces sp. SAI-127]|nr:hypothetical protein [Streptomyces sp. SAI-127]
MSPRTITSRSGPGAFEQEVREGAQGRRLGRPPVEGVGAEAGPFGLVVRLEAAPVPVARIRQQLRLEMGDRHLEYPVAGLGLHGEEAAARLPVVRVRLGAVVTLHGAQLVREHMGVPPYPQGGAAEETDADAPAVRVPGERDVPVPADRLDQIGECLLLPDLLDAQQRRVERGDHGGQGLHFRLVLGLGPGSAVAAARQHQIL